MRSDTETRQLVIRLADRLAGTLQTGRFTMPLLKKLASEQGVPPKTTARIIKELATVGPVSRFEAGNRTEYTTPAARPNLRVLYERAAAIADPAWREERQGRLPAGAPRDRDGLNTNLLGKIKTAVRKIGAYMAEAAEPDEEAIWVALGRIERELMWDPAGGSGGRGDWSRALEILRRAGGSAQDASALRALLDLAATKEWLPATERHDPTYTPIPPEWSEIFNDWRRQLLADADPATPASHRRKVGLIALLEVCAALRLPDPRCVTSSEWQAVVDELEARFRADSRYRDGSRRTDVRRVYRDLRNLGVIGGPEWDARAAATKDSIWLISGKAGRQIGRFYGGDVEPPDDWDWRTWPWPECGELRALIEGALLHSPGGKNPRRIAPEERTYGLRHTLRAMTSDDATFEGLPDRKRYPIPEREVRRIGARSKTPWSQATVQQRLCDLGYVAGWMREHLEIDWTKEGNDLRVLLDIDHLRGWVAWMLRTRKYAQLAEATKALARLASPILEAMALQAGDQTLALRANVASRYLSSGSGVVLPGNEIPTPSVMEVAQAKLARRDAADAVERAKAETRRNEAAWTADRRACTYAIEQMERVRDAEIERIERRWGPLEQQVAALLDDPAQGRRLGKLWANRIKKALWYMEELLVPLRPATLPRIEVGHRIHDAEMGEIRAHLPGPIMKRKKPFRPMYAAQDAGSYHALYRLYRLPGGALEVNLGRPPVESDPYWPADDGSPLQGSGAFSGWLKSLVRRNESALLGGGTFEALRQAQVLSTRYCRHAVATRLVRLGMRDLAVFLLHHASEKMVREVYADDGEEHYDAAAAARTAAAAAAARRAA